MTMDPILQFFAYGHLPLNLADVSAPFHTLAHTMVAVLPRNAERSAALRKLLEAKDCAVRAYLFKEEQRATK
jgi:ferritin-like protein